MSPRARLTVACVASFIAGALLIGGILGQVMEREFRNTLARVAYENAVRAQTAVHQLTLLRAGDTPRVISELDTLLDAHTMQLASYEENVPPDLRNSLVYRALADVRRYRGEYPLHIDNPTVRAEYQKALDLGMKPATQ